jgi:hypothetical protein
MLDLRSALAMILFAAACGGHAKPANTTPDDNDTPNATTAKKPPPETEEDREAKRARAAAQIVPADSTCLPAALKGDGAPHLELASVDSAVEVCAIDDDKTRLLGPIACWKVNTDTGALTAAGRAPLPSHGFDAKLADGCTRGLCLPADAKKPGDDLVHLAWNTDGTKAAMLAGDDVHVYDAGTKQQTGTFSIRNGDKGLSNDPVQIYFVADHVFVIGADPGPSSAVWEFKLDGTPIGAIEPIGSKDGTPINLSGGSFSVLDKSRVGASEQGATTLTTVEVDNGKRTKLVRNVRRPPCKPAELDSYWLATKDKIGPSCQAALDKDFAPLVGAGMIAGTKSFVVLLRGPRLGEIALLDNRTLAEKRAIKLPWCDAGN